MSLLHIRRSRLFYFHHRFRACRDCLARRWKSNIVNSTISEEQQFFPRRQFLKDIERRIRAIKMETEIMKDIGMTKETLTRDPYKDRLSSVSVIASRYLLGNASKFTDDLSSLKSDVLNKARAKEEISGLVKERKRDVRLPLGKFATVNYSHAPRITKKSGTPEEMIDIDTAYDRGFHVEGDLYKDEYVAGTLTDLPAEDELKIDTLSEEDTSSSLTRVDRKKLKRLPPYRIRYGPSDAVEEVELLHPMQEQVEMEFKPRNAKHKKNVLDDTGFGEETENEEWRRYYGTADPSIKPTNENNHCAGCGASFHCQDSSLPGFLPATLYLEKQEAGDFSGTTCRRCYLLRRHNFLVNVSVSPVDYERVLGRLRTIENALIVLLVDMTDFPACIYPKLPDLIGIGKPMIVVGTKVDLLPPDAESGYIRHFHRCLRRTVIEMGFGERMNLLDVMLVSAKTGYGVEELVSMIFSKWAGRGDAYLIGCTNTGKSTLFNALLQSDLCKARAVDLVERATTCLWPGTTLNLLKFPVMNPTDYRLMERIRRLREIHRYADAEERHRRVLLEETGDSKYAVLQGIVDRTPRFEMEDPEEETDDDSGSSKIRPKLDFTKQEFVVGRWCFDTPGTVHREQIINYLSLDELIKTVPRSMITPRTFALGRNETLFIGGLARIDHLAGPSGTLLTIFASDQLPVYVEDTRLADAFYKDYVGTAALAVPYGDKKRLESFPSLKQRIVKLIGAGFNEACADVTLSSSGWTTVTSRNEDELELGVWTPGGVGVFVRRPSLYPFIANERGPRITGTNSYAQKPLRFPSDEKQKRA